LSWWKNLIHELFEILQFNIKSWRNNTTFIQSTIKFNNNFAWSSIINNFKFTDISLLLHLSKELNNDLWNWSQNNLKNKFVKLYQKNRNLWQLISVIPYHFLSNQ
jgi:hypothetical protein